MDLLKLVEKELLSGGDSKNVISLWNDIYRWYEEGGKDEIESNLLGRLQEGESTVSKNIRGLSPEIQTAKKKAKKRRK